MCRVLKISRSGFYAWDEWPMSARARRNLWLTGKIETIHRRSRGVYGSPNIHAQRLRRKNVHGSRVVQYFSVNPVNLYTGTIYRA
jgi:putative transposase